MSGINVTVDARKWEAALDFMVEQVARASMEASEEAAKGIQRLARTLLMELSHTAGTKTPAPWGGPPAMISGDLADSILVTPHPDGFVDVGPTARQGRIQELGGEMHGHPLMHYFEDGRWHDASLIRLPERAYLKPATDHFIDSGDLIETYARKWAEAEREATA